MLNFRGCKNEAGTCKLNIYMKEICSSHMHVLKGYKEMFKNIKLR